MRLKTNIALLRMKFFLFALFLPFAAFNQDISGVWVGTMYNDTTKENIHYELAINESKGKADGFSHTTFIINGVKNIGVKEVKINMKDDRLHIVDEKFVYNNYAEPPAKGVRMSSDLVLSENDSAEVLSGSWKTNATRVFRPLTGSLFLERKKKTKPQETQIVAKLIQLGLSNKLSFLSTTTSAVAINNKPVIAEKSITSDMQSEALRAQQEKEAIAKAEQLRLQKEREDSIKDAALKAQQEREAIAKAEQLRLQKEREDSIKSAALKAQQEKEAIAKAEQLRLQKEREDSIKAAALKAQQEKEAIAKAEQLRLQKEREDSIKAAALIAQQEKEAIAKAEQLRLQKEREDSIKAAALKAQQEREAIAKAKQLRLQKEREDSIKAAALKAQQEREAIAKAEQLRLQKEREDSIKAAALKTQQEREAIAKAEQARQQKAQEESLRSAAIKAQQEKENLAKAEQLRLQKEKADSLKAAMLKAQQEKEALAKAEKEKEENQKLKAAAEIEKRKIETIQTVEISQDSLELSLYDNGAVDGDTVTVLINGKVVMPRVGLLERATNKKIYLTPDMGDSISIVMYAENLGSIPPNTGLLVIREAKRIFEIRFSGDLKKNAKIILVRKKKE